MRSAPLVLSALAALGLSACASARKADVRLPAAYEAPAATAPAGAIALDTWWTAYGDPELNQLVEQALAHNPDVRTALSRLDEVRAQRRSAIDQYLPQGDPSGTSRRTKTTQLGGTPVSSPGSSKKGPSISQSANFNVAWEVDPSGRAIFGPRAATAEVERARFAYEVARAGIAAET